jgi:hypothetical protein
MVVGRESGSGHGPNPELSVGAEPEIRLDIRLIFDLAFESLFYVVAHICFGEMGAVFTEPGNHFKIGNRGGARLVGDSGGIASASGFWVINGSNNRCFPLIWMSFANKLLECSVDIERIPENNHIDN